MTSIRTPRSSKLIEWDPINGATGALIRDVDVREIDADWVAECRRLVTDRCVVVIPGQHLTAAEQVTFSGLWGERYVTKASEKKSEDHPELLILRNYGKDKIDTETWHSDVSFLERPPAFGILSAHVVPFGGDTIFANQYLAYAALSDTLRGLLDGMHGIHEHLRLASNYGLSNKPWSSHPAIRTIPETGRKCLYVSSCYTTRFEGMTEAESSGLLRYLTDHAVSNEFIYRHHWTVGDLVIWDNRCTQHYAVHDYGDQERLLYRAAMAGERPE